ncbi:MAG: hypothetical protein OSJ64_03305, partial [Firmicutes bacterium]|nr:hypothetical protein [Bacillota bacterium]
MPETNRSGFALFRDKKPTSAFYIILFMILLVMVLGFSGFSILRSIWNENQEVEVKQYCGLPLEEAVALIAADELQHSISYAYSTEYEKDIVINQNI